MSEAAAAAVAEEIEMAEITMKKGNKSNNSHVDLNLQQVNPTISGLSNLLETIKNDATITEEIKKSLKEFNINVDNEEDIRGISGNN